MTTDDLRALWDGVPEWLKYCFDCLSTTALLATIAQLLPHFASLLTVIWMAIRIFETATVQRWLGRDAPPPSDNG